MMRFSTAAASMALVFGGTCAQAQEPKQTIMPEDAEARAFQEQVGFSDAVIHGDTIWMSGVIAVPQPGDEGMKPAFDRVFKQLSRTLERVGATWDDVLEIQTFHTDMQAQIFEFADVKNEYIKAPFPAWTAIGVNALYEPEALVEVKLIVRNPAG